MAEAFIGGEKMRTKLQSIMKKIRGGNVLRVGFLQGSTCGENGASEAPTIALLLDRGAPEANIPPRPFMRQVQELYGAKWAKKFAKSLPDTDYEVGEALAELGQEVVDQIKTEIDNFTDPPNAPSTIKRKGSSHPLIDSGNLREAPSFEIGEGE